MALVQDAHGELATQVSLLGDDPMLALLVPEAAETLAQLLEAFGLSPRREHGRRRHHRAAAGPGQGPRLADQGD